MRQGGGGWGGYLYHHTIHWGFSDYFGDYTKSQMWIFGRTRKKQRGVGWRVMGNEIMRRRVIHFFFFFSFFFFCFFL